MNAKQFGLARLALINARNTAVYYADQMKEKHPGEELNFKIELVNDDLKWAAQYLQDAINKLSELQNELSQHEKEQTK